MAMCLLASTIFANAQDAPSTLTGKYRCELDPRECLLGQTFSVKQSGERVEFAKEKGEALFARMTTERSLAMGAPWNALGVIYGNDIQWSNGTKWVKTE